MLIREFKNITKLSNIVIKTGAVGIT